MRCLATRGWRWSFICPPGRPAGRCDATIAEGTPTRIGEIAGRFPGRRSEGDLPVRHRQPSAQHSAFRGLREVVVRGVGEEADDLLARYRMSTRAAPKTPERSWRSVRLLECDRDPPSEIEALPRSSRRARDGGV